MFLKIWDLPLNYAPSNKRSDQYQISETAPSTVAHGAVADKKKKNRSKYLKIIHMWRRWGTPQNFFLAFIDELEKQITIKKTVEVGQ